MTSKSENVGAHRDEVNTGILYFILQLPNEIVLTIFEMLPPSVLIELQKSNHSKIKSAAFNIRVGDFRLNWDCSENVIQTFLRSQSSTLRELYLDNLAFVNPDKLPPLIRRCSQLKVLSVKNCGLAMWQFVYAIEPLLLDTAAYLLQFDTNPIARLAYRIAPKPSKFHLKGLQAIKHLYLDVPQDRIFIQFWDEYLQYCPNLVSLTCVFSNIFLPSVSYPDEPITDENSPAFSNLEQLCITWPISHYEKTIEAQTWKNNFLLHFLNWIFKKQQNNRLWQSFWITNNALGPMQIYCGCKLIRSPNIFYTKTEVLNGNSKTLDLCEREAISQFGMHVNHIEEKLLKIINQRALKKLAIMPNLEEVTLIDVSSFFDLLSACRNITDLDIRGVHTELSDNISFCPAISSLKYLKRLLIPICCIACLSSMQTDSSTSFASPTVRKRQCIQNSLYETASALFEQMVISCPGVEEFCLSECIVNKDVIPYENVISEMHRWNRLKHFTLDGIKRLDQCIFLRKVATNCSNFTSFHLLNCGTVGGMIYMPMLIHVLNYAKNLTFLRIMGENFVFSHVAFWKGISSAKNLRGLCFCIHNLESHALQMAYNAVKELKNFHVFHLRYDIGSIAGNNAVDKLKKLIRSKCHQDPIYKFIFYKSAYFSSTFSMQEPGCHFYHCGIRDSSLVLP